ncbi:MAG: glycosyltransferase family 2 protein [Thermoplasmata archaeon]
MPSPRVLVLVLNYNAGATLEACLRSLQETTYPNAELVVLDNGSTDGSAGIPPRLGIKTHLFGANLGYSAAYNRAFRELGEGADFFLISNPDLVVPPPTIERLVAAAVSDETVGFVGPLQRHTDSHSLRSAGVRWSCGGLPRHVERPGEPYDYVEGAFLLVRREVLDRVGGPDERLGMNLEDLDWQRRAAAVGFRNLVEPDAEVLHHPPGEVRRTTGSYYQSRNVCIVTSRYCGRGALIRVRMRLYLEGILGTILGRPRGPFILEGLRDFRRGVTGLKVHG